MNIFVLVRTQLPNGPTVVQCAFLTREAANAEVATRMNTLSWDDWAWQIMTCHLKTEATK